MTDQNNFMPSDFDKQDFSPEETAVNQPEAFASQQENFTEAQNEPAEQAAASHEQSAEQKTQSGYQPPQSESVYSSYYVPQGASYPEMPQAKKQKKEKKPHHGAWLAAVIACAFLFSFIGSAAGFVVAQNGLPFLTEKETSKNDSILQTGSGGAPATTVSEVADIAADSVVEITTESATTGNFFQQQILTGAGSGVIVTADGHIVTNHHVIEGSNKITVTLHDGTKHEAKLIGSDEKTDLAVLKIEATGLKPVTFGSSADLKVGEQAVVIGNPLGQLGGSVTSGIISALDREITVEGHTMRLLQTDTAVNPGNSGGGLFNAKGELVGIINAKSGGENVEGIGFAIPSDTVKEIVNALMKDGYVPGRVALGINVVEISDVQTAMQYRVDTLGVYIASVNEGSQSEKAGLKAGDRLVAIGNREITSIADITTALDDYSVGDSVKVTVAREGKTGTATIKLEEKTHTAAES